MKTRSLVAISVTAATLLSALIAVEKATGVTPESPLEAVVDRQTLMGHVVEPAAYLIWGASGVVIDAEGTHEMTPKNEEEWVAVVNGAATLAEATNLMMLDGRVEDEQWFGFVQVLRSVAIDAWHAAEAQDAQAISDAGDRLVEACSACHKNYGYLDYYD